MNIIICNKNIVMSVRKVKQKLIVINVVRFYVNFVIKRFITREKEYFILGNKLKIQIQ
jgi:hypothetical protein